MGGHAQPGNNSYFYEAGIHYPNQTAQGGHSNKLQLIDALCELTAPAHGQSGRPSLASGRALFQPPTSAARTCGATHSQAGGKAPRKPQRVAQFRAQYVVRNQMRSETAEVSAPGREVETSSARPHGVNRHAGRAQPERVVHAHGPQERSTRQCRSPRNIGRIHASTSRDPGGNPSSLLAVQPMSKRGRKSSSCSPRSKALSFSQSDQIEADLFRSPGESNKLMKLIPRQCRPAERVHPIRS